VVTAKIATKTSSMLNGLWMNSFIRKKIRKVKILDSAQLQHVSECVMAARMRALDKEREREDWLKSERDREKEVKRDMKEMRKRKEKELEEKDDESYKNWDDWYDGRKKTRSIKSIVKIQVSSGSEIDDEDQEDEIIEEKEEIIKEDEVIEEVEVIEVFDSESEYERGLIKKNEKKKRGRKPACKKLKQSKSKISIESKSNDNVQFLNAGDSDCSVIVVDSED